MNNQTNGKIIQQFLDDLQHDSAKRRWSTIRKIARSPIPNERIVNHLEKLATQDPVGYVRDEAQKTLNNPIYQTILQRRIEDPVKWQEMSNAIKITLPPTLPKFLGIPRWVFALTFAVLVIGLPLGLLFKAYWDYDLSIHSPVSVNGGVNGAVEVWVNKKCFVAGEQMVFRATATNQSSYEYVTNLDNEPALNLIVGIGESKFQWSAGKSMTSDLTHLRLKPGESKTIEMRMTAPDIHAFGWVYAPFKFRPDDSPGGHPNIPIQVGQCLPGFIGH